VVLQSLSRSVYNAFTELGGIYDVQSLTFQILQNIIRQNTAKYGKAGCGLLLQRESLCILVTFVSHVKMAELIEMPFGWAQGTIYHMGVQIPQGKWAIFWGCLIWTSFAVSVNP